MFGKILRRLTILNSSVFLLMFIAYGLMLYGDIARELFNDVDVSMRGKADAIRIINGRPSLAGNPPGFFDPRILILWRDTEGNILNLYPFPVEGIEAVIPRLSQMESGIIHTKRIDNHVYRVLSQPYQHGNSTLLRPDAIVTVQGVIAVTNVDSEVAILRRLMVISVAGLVVGMLAIVPAGYYLARRALVPIQAAWEKQQQFVADASHELRTPLTVIKSNAELLLRHPEHTVQQEGMRITNVLREAMRMNRLVATLLTLARADANKIELHEDMVILNEIVDTVAEQFYPLAEMKQVVLKTEMDDNEINMIADKERLHQLLVILLDNAIKYTPQAGRITFSCRKQGNSVLIIVADTGCGIQPRDIPYVFDRFFRGDKARSRETGGAGLGLAIAEWIVAKHGGRIWVESEVGVGTQFYVNIPIKYEKALT